MIYNNQEKELHFYVRDLKQKGYTCFSDLELEERKIITALVMKTCSEKCFQFEYISETKRTDDVVSDLISYLYSSSKDDNENTKLRAECLLESISDGAMSYAGKTVDNLFYDENI